MTAHHGGVDLLENPFGGAGELGALLDDGAALLARARVPSPEVDAELLLGHVLGFSRGELHARRVIGGEVSAEASERFRAALERRASREPLQHITGLAAFRHLELEVGPGVFVPRPETEITAQIAIDALRAVPTPEPRAADLGTGSGAIGLALATEVPHAAVTAVENSPEAFIWARGNARRIGAENLRLVFDDLARALPEEDGRLDVVVSNPPYVPDAAIPRDPEVQRYDPRAALYGGADGLDVVRRLERRASVLLRSGGTLVIEHAEQQGAPIRELLTERDWRLAATLPDLSGRDRVTTAVR